MFIAFAAARRPDRARVRSIFASGTQGLVSLDPPRDQPRGAWRGEGAGSLGNDWLELLSDGLAFDCLGLAPGAPVTAPAIRHWLGPAPAGGGDTPNHHAIGLFAGPHCVAAANALPVVRAQMRLACALVRGANAAHSVRWSPAGLAMPPALFLRAVEGWLEGRPFPAIVFVAFAQDAAGSVETDGLAFFTGQEISVAPDAVSDSVAAVRLLSRLIAERVAARPVTGPYPFTGQDGESLLLEPVAAGRLRVRKG